MAVDAYFNYDAMLKVCICAIHKRAIPPTYIERYFQDHHKDLDLKLRRAIKTRVSQLTLAAVDAVQMPEHDQRPIKHIGVFPG